MTAPLRTLVIGYRTRLAACQRLVAAVGALIVTAMTVALPSIASAQRADASIGVSLTILPPTAAGSVAVSALRIDRDGATTIWTMTPRTAQMVPLVMMRVSSAANGFVPTRYTPALPCSACETQYALGGLRYYVDVGRSVDGTAPRDVHLRIEYLVVAGT